MHRRPLLDALDAYLFRHPGERGTVLRLKEFVVAHPDCFERTLRSPGHVTGSAWIVAPEGDAVLLTHHRKLDLWVQLGGHADGDPDVVAVARREGLEESGLPSLAVVDPLDDGTAPVPVPFDLDIHVIPARKGEPEHLHFDVRYAFRAPTRTVVVSDESHDLAWVPVDAVDGWTPDPSVSRMARKWLEAAPLAAALAAPQAP